MKSSNRKTSKDIKDKSKPPKNKDYKTFRRTADNKKEKTHSNGTGESPEIDDVNEECEINNHFKNTQSKKSGSGVKKYDRKNASISGDSSSKERNDSKKSGPNEGNGICLNLTCSLFCFPALTLFLYIGPGIYIFDGDVVLS